MVKYFLQLVRQEASEMLNHLLDLVIVCNNKIATNPTINMGMDNINIISRVSLPKLITKSRFIYTLKLLPSDSLDNAVSDNYYIIF